MKLSNQRISLRAPEPEDLEIMHDWENNTGLWPVSETIEPFSRFQMKQYIEKCGRDIYSTKQLRLMIEDIEKKVCVGMIDMFQFDPFHQKAGIGIIIGSDFRNQNYASDALDVFCNYAFGFLKLHMLWSEIMASNTESIRLFEKSGFTCYGKLKDWRSNGREFSDVFLYQKINNIK